jgi:hypothetical protein
MLTRAGSSGNTVKLVAMQTVYKEALMYTVDYGYFNYPMQTKRFATYEAAKKFFYFIRKDNRVKRVELTCP